MRRLHLFITSHKTAFLSFVALMLSLLLGDDADQIIMAHFPGVTEPVADVIVTWCRTALGVLTYLGFSPVRDPHKRPPGALTRAEDPPTFPLDEERRS